MNSETDFGARGDSFLNLSRRLVATVLSTEKLPTSGQGSVKSVSPHCQGIGVNMEEFGTVKAVRSEGTVADAAAGEKFDGK